MFSFSLSVSAHLPSLNLFSSGCFLIGRYSVGECRLTEETPPVLSAACPPGRLLLLADRHAGCPGALGSLPQRCHQKKLHSVNPRGLFILSSTEKKEANARQETLLQSKWQLGWIQKEIFIPTWPLPYQRQGLSLMANEYSSFIVWRGSWIEWLNSYRLHVTGL